MAVQLTIDEQKEILKRRIDSLTEEDMNSKVVVLFSAYLISSASVKDVLDELVTIGTVSARKDMCLYSELKNNGLTTEETVEAVSSSGSKLDREKYNIYCKSVLNINLQELMGRKANLIRKNRDTSKIDKQIEVLNKQLAYYNT